MFTLQIQDQDILSKLQHYAASEEEMESLALLALRIGLEAIPVMRGGLDQQALQQVGADILLQIQDALGRTLESYQERLLSEFSLDVDNSAMQRLQQQITQSYDKVNKAIAGKEATVSSTQGGMIFEDALYRQFQEIASGAGDSITQTGNEIGKVDRSKMGDYVVTLGEGCIAAGERIVIEAKRNANYTRSKILDECAGARKNRAASMSIFVWDEESSQGKQSPLERNKQDIIVLWDMDKPETTIYLKAAYWLARSLVIPKTATASKLEITNLSVAFEDIQKQLAKLEAIKKTGERIEKDAKSVSMYTKEVYDTLEVRIEQMAKNILSLSEPNNLA